MLFVMMEAFMKWYFAAPVALVLTACGTPQEQCIGGVSHDLNVLNRLIDETQGNIARGYGYADTVIDMPQWVDCTPFATTANPSPKPQMCFDDVPTRVTKPVAIDLAAEQAKLDSMLKRREEMTRALAPQIADCKARYPE